MELQFLCNKCTYSITTELKKAGRKMWTKGRQFSENSINYQVKPEKMLILLINVKIRAGKIVLGKSTSVKALGHDFESSKSTKPGRCRSTHLLTPWHLRQDGKQEAHRPSSLAYTAQTIKKSYSRQARRIRQIPEAVLWRPHEHHSTCVATLTYTLQNK